MKKIIIMVFLVSALMLVGCDFLEPIQFVSHVTNDYDDTHFYGNDALINCQIALDSALAEGKNCMCFSHDYYVNLQCVVE